MPRPLANVTKFVAAKPSRGVAASVSSKLTAVHSHHHNHHIRATPHVSLRNGSLSSVTAFNVLPKFNLQRRHLHSSALSTDAATFPDMSEYRNQNDQDSNRNFQYFMVGSLGVVGAVGAKNIVTSYLKHFTASADVLALAKVEVDLASIPEGKNLVLKWRGKPIFIRHRTPSEIEEANSVNISELRHQETDAERTKKPEWLVMLGVCTHLGCVPIGEAGEYGGWFCPCHGSHYDISGRIRKGPAPLNLEIPEYEFTDADTKIVIG